MEKTQTNPYVDKEENYLFSWINKASFLGLTATGVYPWETYKIA